nr:hypothetical protein BSM_24720 [uncultured archaeon]
MIFVYFYLRCLPYITGKNINIDRVVDRYKKGIPLTEIAAIERVSYRTLRNELRESCIKLETQLAED